MDLSGVSLLDWTPATLLGLTILLILTGQLVPIRTIRATLADKDQQIRDWKDAHAASEAARDLDRQAATVALEAVRTSDESLKGFRWAAEQLAHEKGAGGV